MWEVRDQWLRIPTVDGSEFPANQLRFVVYPIIYDGCCTSKDGCCTSKDGCCTSKVVGNGISEPSTVVYPSI